MTMIVDGSNGLSLAGQFNSASNFGFKNRIINGAMMIDQRNAGASVTIPANSTTYTLDRWNAYSVQASKFTVQQSTTAATGFVNSLLCTSSSAYSVLTGDYFVVNQRIEGLNISDLAWGTASAATVTLSFWVRSSLTGTFGGAIQNSGQDRSYPFSYTISSANTWELKSVTIPGDTTGTWLTTNGVGMRVFFNLGSGATYSGTANTWAGTAYFAPTGATSVVGTNGATFYITGVQLEKGSTATSFDYRPYGTELALCQRYYEKSFNQGTAPSNGFTDDVNSAGFNGFISYSGTNVRSNYYFFKIPKRANPTVTVYNPTTIATTNTFAGYTGAWQAIGSINVYLNENAIAIAGTLSGAATSGAYIAGGAWAASAEL